MDQKQHDRLIAGLNPEQTAVVLHHEGPLLAVAIAGSGKTTALTRRIAYLHLVRGVPTQQILATTFTKKAQLLMQDRLRVILPTGDWSNVRTFHSLAATILRDAPWFRHWTQVKTIKPLIKDVVGYRYLDLKGVCISSVESFIGLCKSRMADPDSDAAIDVLEKGHFPENHIAIYEKVEEVRAERQLLSFDDSLVAVVKLLDTDEKAREKWSHRFQFVLQDEGNDQNYTQSSVMRHLAIQSQNYMVCGDPAQCIPLTEKVVTPRGLVRADSLRAGDQVVSYRNGKNATQHVSRVVRTGEKDCVRITTDGGRSLTMSVLHQIWASPPKLQHKDQHLVYMMYRPDLGFRVGVTNRGHTPGNYNNWGNRMRSEGASRLWILARLDKRADALRTELEYSLTFGVPTLVFDGLNRGMDQNRIDAIYAKFGDNGLKILAHKNFSFDLPHWMQRSGPGRNVINLVAHTEKGSMVNLEGYFDAKSLRSQGYVVHDRGEPHGGHRIRTSFARHVEAESFAAKLARMTDSSVLLRLGIGPNGVPLQLMTAGSLMTGMSVGVRDGERLCLETITNIRATRTECLDLEVSDANNFYAGTGGGILSHNCIYAFQGSDPSLLVDFETAWPGATVIKMDRNYRSGSEIVALANVALLDMDPSTRIDVLLKAERNVPGVVRYKHYDTQEDEAESIVDEIEEKHEAGGKYADNMILYRMNSLSRSLEEEFSRRKIPYIVYGGIPFYERQEAKDILAFMRLADGRASISDARRCINRPTRYLATNFLERMEVEAAAGGGWDQIIERAANGAGVDKRRRKSAQEWVALIREVATMSASQNPKQAIDFIVAKTGYKEWIKNDEGRDTIEEDRLSNIAELARASLNYATTKDFLDHVDLSIENAKRSSADDNVDRVTLMSIHRSKALEQRTVYLIMCNDWVMPHVKSRDLHEEKRIFYVAVTRAMDRLNISWVQRAVSGGRIRDLHASPFIPKSALEEIQRSATASTNIIPFHERTVFHERADERAERLREQS